MSNLTHPVLSIRQPWAWLILCGWKDVENRTWPTKIRGTVLIHAAAGCTIREHDEAMLWIARNNRIPLRFGDIPRRSLDRGGIVGSVEIVDCVTESESPWFVGPYGFVLKNAKPLPFMRCRGKLGFYRLKVADTLIQASGGILP